MNYLLTTSKVLRSSDPTLDRSFFCFIESEQFVHYLDKHYLSGISFPCGLLSLPSWHYCISSYVQRKPSFRQYMFLLICVLNICRISTLKQCEFSVKLNIFLGFCVDQFLFYMYFAKISRPYFLTFFAGVKLLIEILSPATPSHSSHCHHYLPSCPELYAYSTN